MDVILGRPALDFKEIVQLRPPQSKMPDAMMAPIFDMVVSLESALIFCISSRNFDKRSSDCWTKTSADAIAAPCWTKSTLSLLIGSNNFAALTLPVPAQAMPTAIAAPYLACGLYDSDKSCTTRTHCSGLFVNTKPMDMTAHRRTSSETSETATCKSFRMASLFPVPTYAEPII